MVLEEDKFERIRKKNSSDQGTIWRKDVDKDSPIHYQKNLMFAKKLPLNSLFKEALAKLTGNRKPVYSTPLDSRQTAKLLGGTALHLDQQIHYQNYFKPRKNN